MIIPHASGNNNKPISLLEERTINKTSAAREGFES
jgi:hypothetical protein